MKSLKYVLLFGMVAVLVAGTTASAAVAYEGFDYGTDQWLSPSLPFHAGGTGDWSGQWLEHYGDATRDQQLSGDSVSLSYGTTTSGLTTTGGRVDHTTNSAGQSAVCDRALTTDWNLDSNGDVGYQSFLIRQTAVSPAVAGNRLGAGLAESGKNGRIFAGIDGSQQAFIGFNINSRGSATGITLLTDRTYLFVAKFISSADLLGDWVGLQIYDTTTDVVGAEPVALGDWTYQRNVTLTGQIAYWTQGYGTQAVNGQIDEIRIGDSWEDVTGVVPEPATLSLLAFGACMLLRRRRR